MKLQFKLQDFQTKAVKAVVNCFEGQTYQNNLSYTFDSGKLDQRSIDEDIAYKNATIQITEEQFLANIQKQQDKQGLIHSSKLNQDNIARFNLAVEMETGTGKTYCYIKTIFELNKKYGWSKFIIVVPSVAIREGVFKSLEITADHFQEYYNKKANFFIYNSKQLPKIEAFSVESSIQIMIITMQAFNTTSKDQRRIYEELDSFQGRKPMDVIQKNQPILILDEPQKMEGKKTLDSLKKFNSLFILRYSATHKNENKINKIYRLDAIDAYNQKLVKKINVKGISIQNLQGTNGYLYLEAINISQSTPKAKLEFEIKHTAGTIKRIVRTVEPGYDLFTHSNELAQYQGYVVAEIKANKNSLSFTNGITIQTGQALGNVNETDQQRIQIKETIRSHFEKEARLFHKGIKVLSLFFIDEVKKYRDYKQENTKGDYALIFEEEYQNYLGELKQTTFLQEDTKYQDYLSKIDVTKTHKGYFAIDKKTGNYTDSKETKNSKEEDIKAYDLILKDKERLLSFKEPTRFVFSHSALREGWDNPNVFVICMLKHSDSTMLRRQEVGRGLRLCVNQTGIRQDDPVSVHNTNILTVVTNESYEKFVAALQDETLQDLSRRPSQLNQAFFIDKAIKVNGKSFTITKDQAIQIYHYLIKNDYIDEKEHLTETYYIAKSKENLAPLPSELTEYQEGIFTLLDSKNSIPPISNDQIKQTYRNEENIKKREFIELWNRINTKAIYHVNFNSQELIEKSIATLNKELLHIASLQYKIQEGSQKQDINEIQLQEGTSYKKESSRYSQIASSSASIKYDLIGNISKKLKLTRKTIVKIISNLQADVFAKFKANPEQFIAEVIRIIKEELASTIVEHIKYTATEEKYTLEDIFTKEFNFLDNPNSRGELIKTDLIKHVYKQVSLDSQVEKSFIENLESSKDVVVYSKLPKTFTIPTPVGNYTPDWAIAFKEECIKHIYFVAETKGSTSQMQLRKEESAKITSAKQFFEELNTSISTNKVSYEAVDNYDTLMNIVKK